MLSRWFGKDRGEWSIAIESIGTAAVRALAALEVVAEAPLDTLIAQVHRAPCRVAHGLSRERAAELCSGLRRVGVDCRALAPGEELEEAPPEYDVAIAVTRFDQIAAILNEVVALLGVSLQRAQALVCQSPAVVLRGVTANAVQPLRRRLEPLGAEVDAAHLPASLFDILIGPCSAGDRRMAEALIEQARIARRSTTFSDSGLLVTAITFQEMQRLWPQLAATTLPVRRVSQDHQRYDLRLDRVRFDDDTYRLVAQLMGVPEVDVARILTRLPAIIQRHLRHAVMEDFAQKLRGVGAVATPIVLAARSYALTLEPSADVGRAKHILVSLARMPERDAEGLARRGGRLDGPFTSTAAQWLHHALHKAHTRCHVVERS